MNSTIELLKIIDSPFAHTIEPQIDEIGKQRLHAYAVLNKIPLLYLDTLKRKKKIDRIESIYAQSYRRYLKFLDVMAKSAQLLEEAGIEYSIFKTIKPYLAETSDVDILVLNDKDYELAAKVLGKKWALKGYGPQSMTFYDVDADLGIDLHREIAVSYVVYMDKDKLREHTIRKMLPNKRSVTTFTPLADLLVVMTHSTIKEQIYSLAEYFTFLYYSAEMSKKEVRDFIRLVEENANIQATAPFLAMTSVLHEASHGTTPKILEKMITILDAKSTETNNFLKNGMKMPHKYSLLTVIEALLEKSKEEKMRRGLVLQTWKMLKPSFAKSVIEEVLGHYKRETY